MIDKKKLKHLLSCKLVELLVACKPKLPVKGRRSIQIKFTLIELLVVIAIIAILASMLLPALKKARDTTKRIACTNKIKQVGAAVTMYTNDYDGFLPVTWDASGGGGDSWYYVVCPYLGIDRNSFYCPEEYTCPCDKYVWKHPSNNNISQANPSYGLNQKCGANIPAGPYVKAISFKNPSRKVMLGERIRQQEGSSSTSHSFELYMPYLYNYRHGNGSNVFWFDNHVTQENSNNINTFNSDSIYWGAPY